MPDPPVSDEIGAALGAFFAGGSGPTHSTLTGVFQGSGYARADPYDPSLQQPNKETRVQRVVAAAIHEPERARELVEALLGRLRVSGAFTEDVHGHDQHLVRTAQRAFARAGWQLFDDGTLSVAGAVDVSTGGRVALDDQLERLRRAVDDPALLLGTAKDLLEAVAKTVLEELGVSAGGSADFGQLWYSARELLGLLPQQVDVDAPGGPQMRAILQSSWKIAEQVNELRGLQGTGHGRTLPTGVSPEMALLVVREACSVAEFVLTTLDRVMAG
ncbi:MAG: abortive infection family protein [Actinomycetota bacterium]